MFVLLSLTGGLMRQVASLFLENERWWDHVFSGHQGPTGGVMVASVVLCIVRASRALTTPSVRYASVIFAEIGHRYSTLTSTVYYGCSQECGKFRRVNVPTDSCVFFLDLAASLSIECELCWD